MGLAVSVPAWSDPQVPVVYRDDYVTINAGIVDASRGLLRAGDVLTMDVAIRFDPDITRISELDDDFFVRTFADHSAFQLLGRGNDSAILRRGTEAVLQHRWQFQVLACPDDSGQCPGARQYELPVMLIDYDVTSSPGGRPSQRSARLRPWPEVLTLISAFPDRLPEDAELDNWVPAGAMPLPASATTSGTVAVISLAAGGFLLLLVFLRSGRRPGALTAPPAAPVERWQVAAVSLADADLSDVEWIDRYRRSLVWYLLDRKGINPYSRLAPPTATDAQRLLEEVSTLTVVDARQPWLDRLHLAVGWPQDDTDGRP